MEVLDDEQDKLLDHEYDGIRELDNHMPVWWLWLFYFTIAFAVGYLFYYQVFGWGPTQHEEYEQEIAMAEAKYGEMDKSNPIEDYSWTFLETEDAISKGQKLFMSDKQLCYTCHGQNAQGAVGPNLTDEYWMHGCSAKEIAASIIHGYPDMGMLKYGSGTKMENKQVEYLVSYIKSLQGSEPGGAKEPDMNRATKCTSTPE